MATLKLYLIILTSGSYWGQHLLIVFSLGNWSHFPGSLYIESFCIVPNTVNVTLCKLWVLS